MRDELFYFDWAVHEGGYRWVTVTKVFMAPASNLPEALWNSDLAESRHVLVPGGHILESSQEMLTDSVPQLGAPQLLSQDVRWRGYRPLSHTGLFRTFAETTPTREGILSFAHRYGRLGSTIDTLAAVTDPDKSTEAICFAERFEDWVYQIRTMHSAVSLWEMVQNHDTKGLQQFIIWEKYSVRFQSPHSSSVIAGPDWQEVLWRRFQAGDVIEPALVVVQDIVNKNLVRRVSPQLLLKHDSPGLILYHLPTSLLDALWLQFAQAINGNKRYQRCRECNDAFELTPEITRADRVYCSDACRMKAYRRRKSTTAT